MAGSAALKDAAAVVEAVSALGLLFLSDPKRPNAIEIVTGQFPRGSWWSHPRAHDIYGILQSVERHRDVLLAKLLSGKVSLIHRELWPALMTIVTAREPWQTQSLPPLAGRWLATFDEAEAAGAAVPPVSRTVSKEIEARLLVFAESVHTPAGKHETKLESWRSWAARVGQRWPPAGHGAPTIAEAKGAIETAAARLGPPLPRLPWAP
jgi:hypothetical protein